MRGAAAIDASAGAAAPGLQPAVQAAPPFASALTRFAEWPGRSSASAFPGRTSRAGPASVTPPSRRHEHAPRRHPNPRRLTARRLVRRRNAALALPLRRHARDPHPPRPRRRRRLVHHRPRRRRRHPLRPPRRRPLRARTAATASTRRSSSSTPTPSRLDRPFAYDPRLAAPRRRIDTAALMPKARRHRLPRLRRAPPPVFRPGGLIYEIPVRPFTILHPDIPTEMRGTVAALAHPAILDHLTRLGVDAVELMPIAAWIDERHLAAARPHQRLGLQPRRLPRPRSAPLPRRPGRARRHRRRPARRRHRHHPRRRLQPHRRVRRLRPDPVAPRPRQRRLLPPRPRRRARQRRRHRQHPRLRPPGHPPPGPRRPPPLRRPRRRRRLPLRPRPGPRPHRRRRLRPERRLLATIAADPLLADRMHDRRALGHRPRRLPARRTSRRPGSNGTTATATASAASGAATPHMLGELATALAGSSDVFAAAARPARVNFIAAHDGFTLADLVAYRHKHNDANGEDNRDGHGDNHSWNNGVEGPTDDPAVLAERRRDLRALLATLFASRGTHHADRRRRVRPHARAATTTPTPRTTPITWLDWHGRDRDLEAHVAALAALRRAHPALADPTLLTGAARPGRHPGCRVADPGGTAKTVADWEPPRAPALAMVLGPGGDGRLAVMVNRSRHEVVFHLPGRDGHPGRRAGRPGRPRRPRAVVFAERPMPRRAAGLTASQARDAFPLMPRPAGGLNRSRRAGFRQPRNTHGPPQLPHRRLRGPRRRPASPPSSARRAGPADARRPVRLRGGRRPRPRPPPPSPTPAADEDGAAVRRPQVRRTSARIRFREDRRLFADGGRSFQMEMLPPGFHFQDRIEINLVRRRPGAAGRLLDRLLRLRPRVSFPSPTVGHPRASPRTWASAASASATRSTGPGSGTRSRCSRARATSARSPTTRSSGCRRAAWRSAPAGRTPRSSRSSPAFWVHEPQPGDRALRLQRAARQRVGRRRLRLRASCPGPRR